MFNMTQKFLKAKIITGIQKKEFYAFCLFPPWNCFSVAFHEYAYMVHSSFLRFIFYLKKKLLKLTILKKFLSFPIFPFLKIIYVTILFIVSHNAYFRTLSSVMMKRKKIKGMISRIWNSASLIIFQNYRLIKSSCN